MDSRNPPLSGALPAGIRSLYVPGVNGLNMHCLEAGFETPGRPCALLLHGFPELAYSWRKIMLPLAQAGYRVIAPDQRGYGGTTGADDRFEGDLDSFRMLNLVRDQLALLASLEIHEVALLVGHDFGSPVAAWSALIRPDIFRSVVLMSAPFGGPPAQPFVAASAVVHQDLELLARPRKHYQWYYSTPQANHDMLNAAQGLKLFLRAYYHYKSADYAANQPYALASWSAGELAKLPTYYVMDLAQDMAQTVAPHLPDAANIERNSWLSEFELSVYVRSFERSGFQGGLNWYRCGANGMNAKDFSLFSGRTLDVPSMYIAGRSDWGTYQKPGDFEKMQTTACSRMQSCHLLDGAGHWVQQEQPQLVANLLLDFSKTL